MTAPSGSANDTTSRRRSKFFRRYTEGFSSEDLRLLFTRDTRDAYRFIARTMDRRSLEQMPWHRRVLAHLRLFFLAFTLRLPPARRALYGAALVASLLGLLDLLRGIGFIELPIQGSGVRVPVLVWGDGTFWLVTGFVLMNLLIFLEVVDRLSLKNDLEIAREIQNAMLPSGTYTAHGVEAFGVTTPANTVGGDFYDILPLPDGRIVLALGDVAGKGSPAALLMALLLAVLRTLVDQGLEPADLIERLNQQISRHVPPSRFITLFFGIYDPLTGVLTYVNAGQNPPFIRRETGAFEPLTVGGTALAMFEGSRYHVGFARLELGDVLVMYSDGITEAENLSGQPFEELGLQAAVTGNATVSSQQLGELILKSVRIHAGHARLADDLTLLILRRLAPVGATAVV